MGKVKTIMYEFQDITFEASEEDGVLVFGSILISDTGLNSFTELPWAHHKWEVSGDFFCSDNFLKNLKGSPEYVGGDFYCAGNRLETLEGSPNYVGKDYHCSNKHLHSLKGGPSHVGGNFTCSGKLDTLEYAPSFIGGYCCINNNPLTSLGLDEIPDWGSIEPYDTKVLAVVKDAMRKNNCELALLHVASKHEWVRNSCREVLEYAA